MSSPEANSLCIGTNTAPATVSGSYSYNTVIGQGAGGTLMTNTSNTVVGAAALGLATSATSHVAIGRNALAVNLTGSSCTAVGTGALANFTGTASVAIGANALGGVVSAVDNVAVGFAAGNVLTSSGNTCVGHRSLRFLVAGAGNTALGGSSALTLVSGDNNVVIGNSADVDAAGGTNEIIIGQGVVGTASNQIRIGNVNHTTCFVQGIAGVNVTGVDAQIAANGQLGVIVSSQRYKEDIVPIAQDVSEKVLQLQPVSFYYKEDIEHKNKTYGLIAEQVHAVLPELVLMKDIADENGEVSSVPDQVIYRLLPPLLLDRIIKMDAQIKQLQEQVQKSASV